jgi:perosamine synthetase
VTFFVEQPFVRSNYWLNVILVDGDMTQRDTLIGAFHESGLLVRPVWTLLNRLPMYMDCPCAPLPVAERLEQQIISLPSGVTLGG